MALDRISLTGTIDRTTESAQQDQTAHICSLIFIYNLRIMSIRYRWFVLLVVESAERVRSLCKRTL